MHPVGPESPETYWVRRALVVGAFLVLLIIILLFLFNLGGNAGQAAPSNVPATQSASPVPDETASESPSATANPTTSPTKSPSASSSASPGTSSSAQPSRSTSPTASASRTASKSDSPSAKKSDDKTSKPTSDKSQPTAASVTACKPSDLKAKLRAGSHRAKIGKDVGFAISLINKSDQTCRATVDPDNFELKIYSGTDRIWSTDDCAKLLPAKHATLKSKQDLSWRITWDGKRSRKGATCKTQPATPKAGYYYATAQLKGAKPVQWLLVLS